MKAKHIFKKRSSYFPNSILEYTVYEIRDALFYCLTECILKHGHNTNPETIIRISEDTEFKIHEKKEVLAAQLLLTYFPTEPE